MTTTYLVTDVSGSVAASTGDIGAERSQAKTTEGVPRSRASVSRDSFLDVLRAIALTRVIIWHTFGLAFLSWIVATMPIMFFVAGTLLYRSLDGRNATSVLKKRLRRLLVPFWFFGATVLGALSLLHIARPSEATRLEVGQLFAWVVPLVNPTASEWEAGWASAPLWYLRCYLWILLLSPLLLRGWRRWGYGLLGPAAVIVVATQAAADRITPGANDPIWILGDLGLYSMFVLLGFANAEGRLSDLSRRDLVEWALIGASGAAVAWQVFPSPDGVANHSYPTLAWLGIAWLAAIALLRPWLSRADEVPGIGPVVRWMTSRAMSIYLWHSPVIVLSYVLTRSIGIDPSPLVLLALVGAGVVVMSVATGWIEDLAGGRPAELWPGRPLFTSSPATGSGPRTTTIRTTLVGFVAATILLGLIARPTVLDQDAKGSPSVDAASGLGLPPAPSGRPDPTAAVPPAAPESLPMASSTNDEALAALVDQWRTEHGVAGVRVGLSLASGERRTVLSGANEDGSAIAIDDIVPVTSITKTMTAALIVQLRDEGLLELDDTIPGLVANPDFAHSGVITYRQLLDHSSGLAPYQEAIGYDPSVPLDPVSAINLAGSTPLQWEPGTVGGYSNSGFLTLGRLIEQLTGESYDQAIERRILGPVGLTSTELETIPVAGWVGDSAGGIVSNVGDLLTWGDALYRAGSVVSPASLAEMTRIDPELASGLGTFPVCPCVEEGGALQATSIGHNGGSVALQFAPSNNMIVVASFTESFWTNDLSQADVYSLLESLRAAVGS